MRARSMPLRYRPTTDSIAIAIVHDHNYDYQSENAAAKIWIICMHDRSIHALKIQNAQKEKNNDNRQHDADQQEQPVLIH